jgi:short-subunit dehydrogenase
VGLDLVERRPTRFPAQGEAWATALIANAMAVKQGFYHPFARYLAASGVHVTALCPGFTYTEFHDANGMRATVSKLPKWLWLDSPTVARLGVEAVEAGRTRVVTGFVNRVVAAACKYLPDWTAKALVGSRSKDFRNVD